MLLQAWKVDFTRVRSEVAHGCIWASGRIYGRVRAQGVGLWGDLRVLV